jgi:hypothetical protein
MDSDSPAGEPDVVEPGGADEEQAHPDGLELLPYNSEEHPEALDAYSGVAGADDSQPDRPPSQPLGGNSDPHEPHLQQHSHEPERMQPTHHQLQPQQSMRSEPPQQADRLPAGSMQEPALFQLLNSNAAAAAAPSMPPPGLHGQTFQGQLQQELYHKEQQLILEQRAREVSSHRTSPRHKVA